MSPVSGSNAPLFFVMNAASGKNDKSAVCRIIEQALSNSGRSYQIRLVENSKTIEVIAREAVSAAKACKGVVVAVGGDGTISAVAKAVHGSGCTFGVLPQGTFNYFARTHGIPEDLPQAIHNLLNASVHPVQVGLLNDRLFLVNASIGFYRKLLEDREAYKKQYGRSRWVAYWSGLMTILRQRRQLRLTLEKQGMMCNLRTPTLFIGNNQLQLEQIGIPLTRAVNEGQLVAIVVPPVSALTLIWLGVRGTLGKLGESEHLNSFGFKRLIVKPSSLYRSHRVKVALDGEVVCVNAPLEFQVSPTPLSLLMPDPKFKAAR